MECSDSNMISRHCHWWRHYENLRLITGVYIANHMAITKCYRNRAAPALLCCTGRQMGQTAKPGAAWPRGGPASHPSS